MKAKPLLEDKLVTWKRAYEAVLAELLGGYVVPKQELPEAIGLAVSSQIVDLRCAAARTAAILIQGIEHGND